MKQIMFAKNVKSLVESRTLWTSIKDILNFFKKSRTLGNYALNLKINKYIV